MPPQSSTSRRKPKDDDAAYIGASGSKRPRDSVDKMSAVPDGRRAKRKKVQSVTQELAALPPSLVDFTTLPREVVQQYLVQFDITPVLHPSPISAMSPPPPETLLGPQPGRPIRFPSPTATVAMLEDDDGQQHHQITNTNVRPSPQQRQPDRSMFSVKHHCSPDDEDDVAGSSSFHRTVTLADIADLDIVLARLAERHFREGPVHEMDTLATFLALVKNSANAFLARIS
ncbi:hypothetical protein BJ322DRAFT_1020077 [Thelephora terrestris]|uniref:Histone deacetylase complex subunit SAP30 Sin3 binding domain-containing protein n=1 Tax=Thelephora terrestris TaxID=56493 RepID=A0A9P6L7D8_9AGAM|nr:hypothetical protein BJ322DRAFT_1020077 [Thelephora terrestris]